MCSTRSKTSLIVGSVLGSLQGQLRRAAAAERRVGLLNSALRPGPIPVDALDVAFYAEATRGSLVVALCFFGAAATACGLGTFEPSVAPRRPSPVLPGEHAGH